MGEMTTGTMGISQTGEASFKSYKMNDDLTSSIHSVVDGEDPGGSEILQCDYHHPHHDHRHPRMCLDQADTPSVPNNVRSQTSTVNNRRAVKMFASSDDS